MTDEKDPALERLFAAAHVELEDDADAFVAAALVNADAWQRRRRLFTFATGFVVLIAVLAMAAAGAPFSEVPLLLAGLISEPIVTLDDGLESLLLAPLNSIAGGIMLGFLAVWTFYRRVFS
jgi:hypothetical protein